MTNTPHSSVVEIHVSKPVLRILRLLRMAALLAGGMLLASCWSSDTLLFPEEEFIDPWGGNFQHSVTAILDGSAERDVTFTPEGKWFRYRRGGESYKIAILPGEYAMPTQTHLYATVVTEFGTESGRTYTYAIGKITADGPAFEYCVLPGNHTAKSRKELSDAMHQVIADELMRGESILSCTKYVDFAPGEKIASAPARITSLDGMYYAIPDGIFEIKLTSRDGQVSYYNVREIMRTPPASLRPVPVSQNSQQAQFVFYEDTQQFASRSLDRGRLSACWSDWQWTSALTREDVSTRRAGLQNTESAFPALVPTGKYTPGRERQRICYKRKLNRACQLLECLERQSLNEGFFMITRTLADAERAYRMGLLGN